MSTGKATDSAQAGADVRFIIIHQFRSVITIKKKKLIIRHIFFISELSTGSLFYRYWPNCESRPETEVIPNQKTVTSTTYPGRQQSERKVFPIALSHPTSSADSRAEKWDGIRSLGNVRRVNWSIKSWLSYLNLRVLCLCLSSLSAGARRRRPSARCPHHCHALRLRLCPQSP